MTLADESTVIHFFFKQIYRKIKKKKKRERDFGFRTGLCLALHPGVAAGRRGHLFTVMTVLLYSGRVEKNLVFPLLCVSQINKLA